jgi:hypothetical protein
MRATTPLAATFITYLTGLVALSYFLKKAKDRFINSKYLIGGSLLCAAIVSGVIVLVNTDFKANANTLVLAPLQTGNQPIGAAKGIYPGRVVWVYNPEATNEDCSNEVDDYWWMDKNTNQDTVNKMLSQGLRSMTGAATDAIAWDSIFHYYNRTHGRGNVGYTAGEKIVIKINLNGMNNANSNANVNTSPQICYAILNQLVNAAGVTQSNISIGDPNVHLNNTTWNKCHTAFSDVRYWGNNGGGRVAVTATSTTVLNSSDSVYFDPLPTDYINATYMINIPVLKKHHRAGISLCSKNHFGSVAVFTSGAWHLHYSLPSGEATGEATNGNYGVYRCFVDIMGHKDLGGKTILYLVDGIWGSTNWGHPAIKWRMSPFNSDWPNSLFLSQDPVAIESVGFDFLFNEFDENHPTEGMAQMSGDKGPFPRFQGTDDFLHQAADPNNWPANIDYDPENDGSILTSMGTHEHWNNATDKQYTRNLGTGNGIELLMVTLESSPQDTTEPPVNSLYTIKNTPKGNVLYANYPNPFSESTTLSFYLTQSGRIELKVFDLSGKIVYSHNYGVAEAGDNSIMLERNSLASGTYVCSVEFSNNSSRFRMSQKILIAD